MSSRDFSYEKWILETYPFPAKPGLDRIRKVLSQLGDPHKHLKFVHVAGTNGKGSTACYINNILISAGFKTGLYTSPGIRSINDRIKINNKNIPDKEAALISGQLKKTIDKLIAAGMDGLSQFEIITCIAFLYFKLNKCDIVVLETGLGGRLDATNVIDSPEAAVLTTISYDHINILGNTLSEIASEKAAIIKKGCIAVCYDHDDGIAQVFKDRCSQIQAEYRKADFSKIIILDYNIEGQVFNYKNIENIYTPMLGEHQVKNAAVAIETCLALKDKGYNLDMIHIIQGIGKTYCEGRMEVLKRNPAVLIDGAHNPEGVNSLVKNLNLFFKDKKITFVLGMMEDKNVDFAIAKTLPLTKRYIAVAPGNPRAMPPEKLARLISKYSSRVCCGNTVMKGLKIALEQADTEDIICVFGSLFLIDEVKNILEGDMLE